MNEISKTISEHLSSIRSEHLKKYIATQNKMFYFKEQGLLDEYFFSDETIDYISYSVFEHNRLWKKIAIFRSVFLFAMFLISFYCYFSLNHSISNILISFLSEIQIPARSAFLNIYISRFFYNLVYFIFFLFLCLDFIFICLKNKENNNSGFYDFKQEVREKRERVKEVIPLFLNGLLFITLFRSSVLLLGFIYARGENNRAYSVYESFDELVDIFAGLLFLLLLFLLVNLVQYIFDLLRKSVYPEGFLYEKILEIVVFLEVGSKEYINKPVFSYVTDFEHTTKRKKGRQKITYNIEQLINPTKTVLSIKSNNPFESELNERVKHEAASKLKEIKSWAYTPKPDTDLYIKKELIAFLGSIASGNIDIFLESSSSSSNKKIQLRKSLLFYSKRFLLVLFRIAIPFTLVFFIYKIPFFNLNEDLYNYLIAGSCVLAVIFILAELDPKADEKYKFLQEIILNFIKK